MRASVRPLGQAIAVFALAGLAAASAASAAPTATATATPLVRITGPTPDQLVRNGRVRLTVTTQPGVRLTTAELNGVDVTGHMASGATKHAHVVELTLARGLQYGTNDVVVRSTGKAARGTYGHVRFVVSKRDPRLVTTGAVRGAGTEAPVVAAVRTAPGTTSQAYVNGRRVDHAFSGARDGVEGRLGANDGLRYGVNRITVVAHKTDASRPRMLYVVQ